MAEMTSPPTPNTILLRGTIDKLWEGRAHAAGIYPGMLVQKSATGEHPYGNWKVHATQGVAARKMIVMEGRVADIPKQTYTGGTIDDAYASGDLMFMHECIPGNEIWGLLKASGTATTLDTANRFLMSAANGCLEVRTTTLVALFEALEVKTPTATAPGTRCRMVAI